MSKELTEEQKAIAARRNFAQYALEDALERHYPTRVARVLVEHFEECDRAYVVAMGLNL